MAKKDFTDNPAMQFLQGMTTAKEQEKVELPKKALDNETKQEALKQGIDPEQISKLTELRNKRIQVVVKPSLFEAMENFKYENREKSVNDIINKAIIEYLNNRGFEYND